MSSTPSPFKRPRLADVDTPSHTEAAVVRLQRSAFLSSLARSVSPPGRSSSIFTSESKSDTTANTPSNLSGPSVAPDQHGPPKVTQSAPGRGVDSPREESNRPPYQSERLLHSPFQLSRIRDLPVEQNVDTVTINDLLGDVMIREAWIFNFLFDVDWIMQQFDADIRSLVSVKIVHGSWKRDSENKIHIDDACRRFPNVKAITAYMPDPFGTHHTKMMVLLRHDDLAQVIIHTANMIPRDWTNMTQAVWQSPLLPLLPAGLAKDQEDALPRIGSGLRFKRDFLAYLEAYDKPRTGSLVAQLSKHDFSAVRGAIIGSVPSKINIETEGSGRPIWGWLSLRQALKALGDQHTLSGSRSEAKSPIQSPAPRIICQVSSIATLSAKWLNETFFPTLAINPTSSNSSSKLRKKPSFSVIFPVAQEIQQSLDGYGSGGSIHTKIQSASQRKQVENLRTHLCHWGTPTAVSSMSAGRQQAAPHIKTYIRFSSSPSAANSTPSIDWALLTSANLSTQAWGGVPAEPSKDVRIQSFELGVLVWPGLYAESGNDEETAGRPSVTKMVPVFRKDTPDPLPVEKTAGSDASEWQDHITYVGLRMPYDLPLQPYGPDEMPWCATMAYNGPDRFGRTWPPT